MNVSSFSYDDDDGVDGYRIDQRRKAKRKNRSKAQWIADRTIAAVVAAPNPIGENETTEHDFDSWWHRTMANYGKNRLDRSVAPMNVDEYRNDHC